MSGFPPKRAGACPVCTGSAAARRWSAYRPTASAAASPAPPTSSCSRGSPPGALACWHSTFPSMGRAPTAPLPCGWRPASTHWRPRRPGPAPWPPGHRSSISAPASGPMSPCSISPSGPMPDGGLSSARRRCACRSSSTTRPPRRRPGSRPTALWSWGRNTAMFAR